jgi:hypothetical protein
MRITSGRAMSQTPITFRLSNRDLGYEVQLGMV